MNYHLMKFLLSRIYTLLYIAVFSGLIGSAVSLPFILIFHGLLIRNMVQSFITGFIIGFCCTLIFIIVYRNVRQRPFFAFLSIAFTIAIGTCTGAILLRLYNILALIILIILSVVIGLFLTKIIYLNTVKLNEKLITTQEKYKSLL